MEFQMKTKSKKNFERENENAPKIKTPEKDFQLGHITFVERANSLILHLNS